MSGERVAGVPGGMARGDPWPFWTPWRLSPTGVCETDGTPRATAEATDGGGIGGGIVVGRDNPLDAVLPPVAAAGTMDGRGGGGLPRPLFFRKRSMTGETVDGSSLADWPGAGGAAGVLGA